MKIPYPYKCDYCGKLKEESNHWFLRPAAVVLLQMVEGQQGRPSKEYTFTLLCWDSSYIDKLGIEHICSEQCATKALSQWMASQK